MCRDSNITVQSPAWLLLVTNLPGQNPPLRMRVWRALKAAGAGLLRDGVYVLPANPACRKTFDEQAAEIRSGGGLAQIIPFDGETSEQHHQFMTLFDRTAEYQEAVHELDTFRRELPRLSEVDARRRLAALGREAALIVARDFFPGEAKRQLQDGLRDAEAALNARFAPDEPHGVDREIPRRQREDYRGRTWATRAHLWVDRVASAWLIRRFIDPEAKFAWLRTPSDLPKSAIGFDFDDAEFTHVGAKVTFEVLLESFGLEDDGALKRLGALVHHLDAGGIPAAEAPGFATILTGARALCPDDDALLETITPVLDSLYAGYSRQEAR